ncbi:MAG: transglycosylase family protein [Candidatus Nanopelagicales bacterium]
MKSATRVTLTASTTALVCAALIGGPLVTTASAAPAAGTDTVATAPAAGTSTAAAKRTATLKKYGVFPLPVSVKQINRYHLSKKDLKGIKKAQKLAKSPTARKIRKRESHNNYKINTGNGYYGAYQFDRGTWRSNGGSKFATTPHKAPKWAQDYVVWRTHKVRGWSPWSTH